MALALVRFNFETQNGSRKIPVPLHIGKGNDDFGVSSDTIHSDTIHSAVLATLYKYFADDDDKLIKEEGGVITSPFSFSSLFPFAKSPKNDSYLYFYPKPYSHSPHKNNSGSENQSSKERKKLKKIAYLDQKLFSEFLENGVLPDLSAQTVTILNDGFATQSTEFNDDFELFEKRVIPRVQVSRAKEDSKPYYVEEITFTQGCGLFALLYCETDATLNQIKELLQRLGEDGIGTDKSLGYGRFTIDFVDNNVDKNIDKLFNGSGEFIVSLGLLSPDENPQNLIEGEWCKEKSNPTGYEIIKRGGWITSDGLTSLRKKEVLMIKPGALLYRKVSKSPFPFGKIWDVSPNKDYLPEDKKHQIHPIYRSGQTICVGVRLNIDDL